MSKTVVKSESSVYVCDECSLSETDSFKQSSWIEISASDWPGVRLFEKTGQSKAPGTRHIIASQEMTFCCKDCAMKFFTKDLQIFLSEIAPPTKRSGKTSDNRKAVEPSPDFT